MSQHTRILAHLKIFKTITNLQAHEQYGIRHLPAVIRDIKKYNPSVVITDHIENGQNRFGEKCWWKVYELQEA